MIDWLNSNMDIVFFGSAFIIGVLCIVVIVEQLKHKPKNKIKGAKQ